MAEGTVYEYFRNKEALLFSIADHQFRNHVKKLTKVFEAKTPLRKLQRLISYHFFLYLTQRDFLKVFLLHVQLNRRFYSSDFNDTYRHYTDIVELILEEGKKDGSIRADINNRVFRNLFLGAFSHMALRWLMFDQKTEADRIKEIDELVLLLSRAVVNNGKEISNKFSVFL